MGPRDSSKHLSMQKPHKKFFFFLFHGGKVATASSRYCLKSDGGHSSLKRILLEEIMDHCQKIDGKRMEKRMNWRRKMQRRGS